MVANGNIIEALFSYKSGLKYGFFYKSKSMLGFSFLLLLSCLLIPTNATGETIFKSGFEKGVTMSGFLSHYKHWKKDIKGADQGYDWKYDLLGIESYWNLLISNKYQNPSNCLELDISNEEANTGARSLHMRHIKKCENNSVNARVSFHPNVRWPYEETHIKYALKFAPDLKPNMKRASRAWVMLNELRMSDANLRICFDIWTKDGNPLKFRIYADDISSGWNPHWMHISNEKVPVGEWFDVEIYFKCRTYAEGGGKYWVKINGKKILEAIPTARKRICGVSTKSSTCKNPSDWNLIKLYSFTPDIEAWLDDFEIYNKLTPTIGEQAPEAPTGLKVIN
jgi:hypothetical protein